MTPMTLPSMVSDSRLQPSVFNNFTLMNLDHIHDLLTTHEITET
jgi:hypothetical protein